jgi:hypothetical protein
MKGKYFTLIGTALTLALSSNIAVAQSTKFPELQADKETKSSPQEKELTPDVMEILCKKSPLNSRCPGGTAVKPASTATPPENETQVAPPSEPPAPAPEAAPPAPDSPMTTPPDAPPAPGSGVTPMTPPSGTGSPEKITPLPSTGSPDGNTSPTPDSGVTPMTPPSSPSNGDTNKITPIPSTGTPDSVTPSNPEKPLNNSGKTDGNVITLPEGKVRPNNGSQLNLPTQPTTPDSSESDQKPASSSDNMKEPSVTSPAPNTLPNSGSEVAPAGEMNK